MTIQPASVVFSRIQQFSKLSHHDIAYVALHAMEFMSNANQAILVANFVYNDCDDLIFSFHGAAIMLTPDQARDMVLNGKVASMTIYDNREAGYEAIFHLTHL
jgi:hypothetical protein